MKQITTDLYIKTNSFQEKRDVIARLKELGYRYPSIKLENATRLSQFDTVAVYTYNKQLNGFNSKYCFYSTMSAEGFFSLYGMPGESETNPPNFVVDTHNSAALREVVQSLAKIHGVDWNAGEPSTAHALSHPYLIINRGPDKQFQGRQFDGPRLFHSNHSKYDNTPVYSARTQMAEIVRLLEAGVPKVEIRGPVIHGYEGKYKRNDGVVTFGCATISVALLRRLENVNNNLLGNRKAASITLDSGKTITIDQIEQILDYVNKVNKE